ncbi:hypothetical protein [Flavobacterium sandaracinum]|uniref:hypothetical protein n=1 Tax=Flavobacterium sandaracinum TaxID=2541733 RepID=UPI003132F01F
MRTIGVALLTISGSIIAAPVVLPAVVISVAGYAALAGGVISVISQLTVDGELVKDQVSISKVKKDNQNSPRNGIK